MKSQEILSISNWKTLKFRDRKLGSSEIKAVQYPKGIYRMEGVKGYEFFRVTCPIKIHVLKINGKISMVDDPLHWIGMEEIAKHSKGKVLVAGLGLGLLAFHLSKNPQVKKIDIVEINPDVIKLVSSYLPKSPKIKIFCEDFFKERFRRGYDTIIIDLFVSKDGEEAKICGTNKRASILEIYYMVSANTTANVFIWGLRNPLINPAVRKT